MQDERKVGGGSGKRAETDDEELLDEGTAGLAKRVAHNINSGLALRLGLVVQGNVGHLLARVEQGVLGRLGEDVLRRTNNDGKEQRGHARAAVRGAKVPLKITSAKK